MKKIIFISFLSLLFFSCNNEPRFTTTAPEIDVAKTFIEAYESQNWEEWQSHYTDSSKIYHNTWKTASSPEEVMASHKTMIANLESYGFEKEPIYYERTIDDEGDVWVNFWGQWIGVLKESKKKVEIPVHLSIRFVDGKNVEEYGFWNPSDYVNGLIEIQSQEVTELPQDAVSQLQ